MSGGKKGAPQHPKSSFLGFSLLHIMFFIFEFFVEIHIGFANDFSFFDFFPVFCDIFDQILSILGIKVFNFSILGIKV